MTGFTGKGGNALALAGWLSYLAHPEEHGGPRLMEPATVMDGPPVSGGLKLYDIMKEIVGKAKNTDTSCFKAGRGATKTKNWMDVPDWNTPCKPPK